MSKVNIPFDFTTPISNNKLYGELSISGVITGKDEDGVSFDYNEIIYRSHADTLLNRPGYNIIDLIKVMGGGDVHEVEFIETITAQHAEKRLAYKEQDFYTDTIQDFEQEEAA